MNRTWIILALWAASPALGQLGSTALFTEFKHQPEPLVLQAMKDEVDSLMAHGGLRFEWRMLPLEDAQTWSELAVLTFQGRCETLPFAINSHLDERLGWTHVSDGVVQPFAEIDCDAIRAYLLKNLLALPVGAREKVYGRAIGRVVAHELMHIFAQTTHHNSHGVDQAALSKADLLAEHLDLNSEETGIVRPRLGTASKARVGSLQAGRESYLHAGCNSCHGERGEGTPKGPVLHIAGRTLSSAVLAAMLTKCQEKMVKRARGLKMTPPSVDEGELIDLARYLNEFD